MDKLRKQIKDLIKSNKEDLLNSHLNYGGVYIANLDLEDNKKSVEVELDEGNIAFTLELDNRSCVNCGGKEFSASQVVRVNVVVDIDNHFLRNESENMVNSVYDADNPYGPYTCINCGEEYVNLDYASTQVEIVSDILEEELKLAGVGVYRNYEDFEEQLQK